MEVSEIRGISDINFVFPDGFSSFEPYIRYQVKEILEIGGEAFVSRTPGGDISGLFTYDNSEGIGTIYTRSREVFDYFYALRPFDYLFAEMKTEHESEVYNIYTIDLRDFDAAHRFSHEVTMADEVHTGELERLMALTYPRINRMWVKVALGNGERCFFIRLNDEIVGWGWVSLVNGIGRFHTLYVNPRFRGMRMGEDLLFARLLWLKLRHARSAFSEISGCNSSCSRVATKGHMSVSGQIFQYSGEPGEKKEKEKMPNS